MNKQDLSLKRIRPMTAAVSTVMKKGGGLFHKIALEKNMLNMPSSIEWLEIKSDYLIPFEF